MSMNLYLARGPQDALHGMARNPDRMMDLTMSGVMARGAFSLGATATTTDKEIENHLRALSREAWKSGLLGGLLVFLLKGKLRQQMRAARNIAAAQDASTPPKPDVSESRQSLPPLLDLHKSWHLLHYLFTGTAWEGAAPANTLLIGGQEVGEDLGYGPARIVDPQATQDFARFLENLTVERLQRSLDLKAMARLEIYCVEDEMEADRAELIDELEHYFPRLKSYVQEAAQRREALAIWMS